MTDEIFEDISIALDKIANALYDLTYLTPVQRREKHRHSQAKLREIQQSQQRQRENDYESKA